MNIKVILLMMMAVSLTFAGTMTDSRDGKTYKTVKIGGQTWMAENLNYETYDSYCYLDKNSNCKKYGRLYTWDAAKSACPDGWHLPSKEEFETLLAYAGDKAAKRLKSTSGWSPFEDCKRPYNRKNYEGACAKGKRGYCYILTCDSDADECESGEGNECGARDIVNVSGNGTDDLGFSAKPSGYRRASDEEYYDGMAIFWSSTESYGEYDSKQVYDLRIDYHNMDMLALEGDEGWSWDGGDVNNAVSVRCVRDEY